MKEDFWFTARSSTLKEFLLCDPRFSAINSSYILIITSRGEEKPSNARSLPM